MGNQWPVVGGLFISRLFCINDCSKQNLKNQHNILTCLRLALLPGLSQQQEIVLSITGLKLAVEEFKSQMDYTTDKDI